MVILPTVPKKKDELGCRGAGGTGLVIADGVFSVKATVMLPCVPASVAPDSSHLSAPTAVENGEKCVCSLWKVFTHILTCFYGKL